MAGNFHAITGTPSVRDARRRYYRVETAPGPAGARDALADDEREFIRRRDSFYLATVNEAGWPYVQHRGGPPGFLRVIRPDLLAFADYPGNRQLLSTGNLAANDRVALFLMDYPRRERLKILGHARVVDARGQPDLAAQLAEPAMAAHVERIFFIDVVTYDWNCPKYITPRHTAEEIQELVAPLRQRITELETQLARQAR